MIKSIRNVFFSTTKRLTVAAAKILLIKTVRIDFFICRKLIVKFIGHILILKIF